MVNRDELSVCDFEFEGEIHSCFVVPDFLSKDVSTFCDENGISISPTGEEGSHVAWDYVEYSSPARDATKVVEFILNLCRL